MSVDIRRFVSELVAQDEMDISEVDCAYFICTGFICRDQAQINFKTLLLLKIKIARRVEFYD